MGRFTPKKQQKPKAPSKKKKGPESFEEFMEEAIQLEEQGERYKTGERAQRNYERAAEMYGNAFKLNDQDADCVYNWGRVLFLLVDFLPSHVEPENKLEKVDLSIEKFRIALNLEANKTDAQFNLAQALHQRSEILQETTEIDNAYGASAIALQEAMSIFDQLYSLQEKEYNEIHGSEEEPTTEEACQEESKEDKTEKEESKEDKTEKEEPKEDKTEKEEPEEFTTATKIEATTEYSLIETLLSTAETMSTMGSMLASFPASMDLFSRAKAKLALAEQWYEKMPSDTAAAETEKKTARVQINLKEAATYASMADRTLLASNTVDSRLFDRATERLDEIINNDPQHVEALCDKGDVLTSYGQALVEVANKKNLSLEANGQEIWHLLSTATKSFQAALAIESKNLKILNKMGDLSLIRAQLELPIAERNRPQLLKNAVFYYKHAVEVDKEVLTSGYIGWAMSEWALEKWTGVAGKKQDALKIIRVWIKRGGDGSLFRNMAEDNEAWDQEFVEFVIENFFDQESEEESE